MIQQIIQYTKGHVRIRVTGSSYERFLNMCAKHDIILWNLQSVEDAYEMNISIQGFRLLKPLAKKSGTKVRILKRYGLPFFLYEHRKRKMLFGGILFGVMLMIFLSCFIWDIRIEGNQVQTDDVIFDFLTEAKITHGKKKSNIDCKALAADLRKSFDNFIWVSVKIQGTRLLIDVQENTDLTLDEKVDYGPSDLISNVNGTVTEIITRAGIPQIKAGDTVKKGQSLVLGEIEIFDDSGEVANYQYCAADADIYVQTVYRYKQTFPMQYKKKEYTGMVKHGYFLNAFNRNLTFIRKKVPYDQYDVVKEEHQLQLSSNFYLPLVWGIIEKREYVVTEKTYTKEEAVRKAQGSLDNFLSEIQQKGVQIFKNNVKIETDQKKCTAQGELILIEKAGKRVERN